MVAYSYQQRFIVPILVGLGDITPGDGAINVRGFEISTFVRKQMPPPKRQTIRAHGKRRHARPGEELQHYTGMRTKNCRLIGRARCTAVEDIQIDARSLDHFGVRLNGCNWLRRPKLQAFARADGFADVADMLDFWKAEHPNVALFDGVIIHWEPLA
jgi:hypothetical protein